MAGSRLLGVLLPIACLVVAWNPATGYADTGLLRSIHTLDDARGYCLDIPGAGQTLRLDAPLQAHTCKYGAPLDDQRFERTAAGALRAPMSIAVSPSQVWRGEPLSSCNPAPRHRRSSGRWRGVV